MKKAFLSVGILTATFILCSNAGFCKTVNNYYYSPQPQVGQNYSIVQQRPNTPNYIVGYNVNQNKYKHNDKHNKKHAKKHNQNRYSNNNYRYNNYNRIGNSYNYQPTLWERIFNL